MSDETKEILYSPAEIDWYIDRFPYRGRILMSAHKEGLITRSQCERIIQMTASRDKEMRDLGENLLAKLNTPRYWGKGPSNYYNKSS